MPPYISIAAVVAAERAEQESDFDGPTRIREMLTAAAPHIIRYAMDRAARRIEADSALIEEYAANGRAAELVAFLLATPESSDV